MQPRQIPEAKRVVITVHGVRTNGRWQKSVTPLLNVEQLISYPHDYKRFGVIRGRFEYFRQQEIERFREEYERVVNNKAFGLAPEDPTRRPSVVAHSFGTYIVTECMRQHSFVRLDKLLLCGSIVSPQFDWSELFAGDQINFVRNLRCMKDWVVPRARWMAPKAGPSGVKGFTYWGTLLNDYKMGDCRHSGFFSEADVKEHWLRFLARRPSEFRIMQSRDIESDATLEDVLSQCRAIDSEVYKNLPGYTEQALKPGQSKGWLEINRDIYTFLLARPEDTAVGYVNAMPITEECFQDIVYHKKADNEVVPRDVVDYSPGSTPALYLMSMAVDPGYKKTSRGLDSEPVERLTNGIVAKLLHYAIQKEVRISKLAAVGWTDIGQKLCKRFQMEPTGTTDRDGHPIFVIDFLKAASRPESVRHPGVQRLLKEYASIAQRQS